MVATPVVEAESYERIILSLVKGVTLPDNTDGYYCGPRTPEHIEPAHLEIELDGETRGGPGGEYEEWVWFMFFADNEPWFKLTIDEAEAVYASLGKILGKDNNVG